MEISSIYVPVAGNESRNAFGTPTRDGNIHVDGAISHGTETSATGSAASAMGSATGSPEALATGSEASAMGSATGSGSAKETCRPHCGVHIRVLIDGGLGLRRALVAAGAGTTPITSAK